MALRYRGYLPHLEHPGATYFVTFRLAGTLPRTVLDDWRFERAEIRQEAERQKRELSKYEKERLNYLYSTKIEEYLDELHGDCWLKEPLVAQLIVNALKHFDQIRYYLHAWTIMPNHVHVIFTTAVATDKSTSDLIPILHSWKSFTAHKANRILNRTGIFWQDEYYDHVIRSDHELAFYINYTLENPVKARLCKTWQNWPWSGCSEEIKRMISG